MRFFIGDTHLMDESMIRLERQPFGNASEKKLTMIDNWNKIVRKDDEVYHLGDVALCDEFLLSKKGSLSFIDKKEQARTEIKEFLEKTNGKKYLIMGNHDDLFTPHGWRNFGFEEVYDKPILIDSFIILSHEPLYNTYSTPFVNIFAHVHGNPVYKTDSPNAICVSVERHDYFPISMDEVYSRLLNERLKNRLSLNNN